MLEPWIIDEIRRREDELRRRDQRPQIELPEWPADEPGLDTYDRGDVEPKRGVVIIGM